MGQYDFMNEGFLLRSKSEKIEIYSSARMLEKMKLKKETISEVNSEVADENPLKKAKTLILKIDELAFNQQE
jgi:hypothetical protein